MRVDISTKITLTLPVVGTYSLGIHNPRPTIQERETRMAVEKGKKVKSSDREAAKVDRSLLRIVRQVAAHEDRGVSETLERYLRPVIQRRLDSIVARARA